jgi:hypothetical protein
VTDKVLDMDKEACDKLLNTFLNEKIDFDSKRALL